MLLITNHYLLHLVDLTFTYLYLYVVQNVQIGSGSSLPGVKAAGA